MLDSTHHTFEIFFLSLLSNVVVMACVGEVRVGYGDCLQGVGWQNKQGKYVMSCPSLPGQGYEGCCPTNWHA